MAPEALLRASTTALVCALGLTTAACSSPAESAGAAEAGDMGTLPEDGTRREASDMDRGRPADAPLDRVGPPDVDAGSRDSAEETKAMTDSSDSAANDTGTEETISSKDASVPEADSSLDAHDATLSDSSVHDSGAYDVVVESSYDVVAESFYDVAIESSFDSGSGSITFTYTGGNQSFTVPAGVTQLTIYAAGAYSGGAITALVPVTPGETLTVVVGGEPTGMTGGFNGGGAGGANYLAGGGSGGGGASDVRQGGAELINRIVIGAGGGGAGGAAPVSPPNPGGWPTGGGSGGASQSYGEFCGGGNGTPGFSLDACGGGGGGGGLFGGYGGDSQYPCLGLNSGGGGSSYAAPRATILSTGTASTPAEVILSWAGGDAGKTGSTTTCDDAGACTTVLENTYGGTPWISADGTNVYSIISTCSAYPPAYQIVSVPVVGGSPTLIGTALPGNEPYDFTTDSTNAYVSDGTNIYQVPLSGGAATTLTPSSYGPTELDVDSTNVYFVGTSPAGLYSVPIGGGSVTTLASSVTLGTHGYSLGVGPSNAYLATTSGAGGGPDAGLIPGTIVSVPLGGGSPVTLFSGNVYTFAVGPSGLYWTTLNGDVEAMPLSGLPEGGSPTTLASALDSLSPSAIAVDSSNVYLEGAGLYAVPIAGGSVTTLTTIGPGNSINGKLAVNSTSLFWPQTGTNPDVAENGLFSVTK